MSDGRVTAAVGLAAIWTVLAVVSSVFGSGAGDCILISNIWLAVAVLNWPQPNPPPQRQGRQAMTNPSAREALEGAIDILDATGDKGRAARHLEVWAGGVRKEGELAAEAWKSIPYFPDYSASTLGRIRSTKLHNGTTEARLLKPCVANKSGHLTVSLRKDGESFNRHVHRLVLLTFVGEPKRNQQCRHLDGDPGNNFLSNLCWGTAKENAEDMIKHGVMPCGERQGASVLTEPEVMDIRRLVTEGETISAVAKQFGVSHTTVSNIVNGKGWKCLIDKPPAGEEG